MDLGVESTPSHVASANDGLCKRIKNDYSFPAACTVRIRFAPKGDRAGLDLYWYDGERIYWHTAGTGRLRATLDAGPLRACSWSCRQWSSPRLPWIISR